MMTTLVPYMLPNLTLTRDTGSIVSAWGVACDITGVELAGLDRIPNGKKLLLAQTLIDTIDRISPRTKDVRNTNFGTWANQARQNYKMSIPA